MLSLRHILWLRLALVLLVSTALGWWLQPIVFPGTNEQQEAPEPTIKTTPVAKTDQQLMATWEKDILPMLEHYCYDCHGDGHSKGKLELDAYPDLTSMRANPKVWEHVLARVDYHLMPPPNKEQPERKERDLLINWINDAIFPVDPNNPDPGHVVIRRMNRIEYQNTVRDLLGVQIDTEGILPPDDSGYGFDNIGSVLTISPAHIEKYLHTAELALDKALVIGPMKAPTQRFDPRKLRGDGRKSSEGIYLNTQGTFNLNPTVTRAGKYLLHVTASAQQAGDEPAFCDVLQNNRQIKRFKVTNQMHDEKVFTVELTLQKGRNNLKIRFPNDFYNPKAKNPERRDRNLMVHRIQLEGPMGVTYHKPATHQRVFITRRKGISNEQYAREIITSFAHRAFRRPATQLEVSRYLDLAKQIGRKAKSFELGIQGSLQAMLVSPSFLFIGTTPPDTRPSKSTQLDEHTLASRLSYFLWSSMPDAELLRLADQGKLRTHLNAQVIRMLKDERSREMIEHFSGQWLQLRDLAVITPDRKRFRTFNDQLRNDMRMETEMLVNHILRGNQSLLDFLDADYSFINERLADHYQIEGVKGSNFRKVQLGNAPRRGILTHASLLTITSQPTRTSPVLRGKFVLENILDITPPPPPPNLPTLEEQKEHAKRLSLREQLAIHRDKKACAGCHNLMDPVGLAYEHFNAIGQFREFDNGRAINASGKLVTGEQVTDAESLRKIISTKKRDEFIRCLTVKMMTYALGRGVTRYDRLTVENILRNIQKDDYHSQALILGIVNSRPFQHQRRK